MGRGSALSFGGNTFLNLNKTGACFDFILPLHLKGPSNSYTHTHERLVEGDVAFPTSLAVLTSAFAAGFMSANEPES